MSTRRGFLAGFAAAVALGAARKALPSGPNPKLLVGEVEALPEGWQAGLMEVAFDVGWGTGAVWIALKRAAKDKLERNEWITTTDGGTVYEKYADVEVVKVAVK